MTQASQLFGSQVYTAGAMTLEALRTAIGAANFETLMRQYQLTYGGGRSPADARRRSRTSPRASRVVT